MISHFPLERLAAALRGDGVKVVTLPDAQGKSARQYAATGYPAGCQAIVEHHSVSSGVNPWNDIAYIDGGKDVGWVISNAYTALDGTVFLIASGPTYTEGAGGPLGPIPADGAVRLSFSNEIASWGAEDSVYPLVQQNAVASFGFHAGRIAAEVWGWQGDPFARHRAFAHFEWAPTRKVDPRGVSRWSPQGGMWNMDAFRAELRSRLEDETMQTVNARAYDSRGFQQQWAPDLRSVNEALPVRPFAASEMRRVFVGMTNRVQVNVSIVNADTGHVRVAGVPVKPNTALVNANAGGANSNTVTLNVPDGHVYVWASAPMDVVVDVLERQ